MSLLVNDCILMYLETIILNIYNFLILYGYLFKIFFSPYTPTPLTPESIPAFWQSFK